MQASTQTQSAPAALTFDELLRHNQEETEHWQAWFAAHPEALDVPLDIANMKDVRGMLLHIFVVEVLYSERMSDIVRERLSYDDFPASNSDGLFAYGSTARARFRAMLANTSDAGWNEVLTYGSKAVGLSITATRRKMFAHVMLHSLRHWAQLATALRQHSYKQDWMHDFIFTSVMP